MSDNDEMLWFLDLLLSHDCSGAPGECDSCLSLQKLVAFMRQEIFSTTVFEKQHVPQCLGGGSDLTAATETAHYLP